MRSKLLIVFILLAGASVSATPVIDPPKSSVYATLRKQGQKLYEKADYRNALLMYKRYYKRYPDQPTAFILSDCYWQLGSYDSAMIYLNRSDLTDRIVKERQAEILARRGNYSAASEIYASLMKNAEGSKIELYSLKRSGYMNAEQLMRDSMDWDLEYLAFNTPAHETAPSLYKKDLFIVSNRNAGYAYPSGKTDYPDRFHFLHNTGFAKDLSTKNVDTQQYVNFDYIRNFNADITLRTSNDSKILLPGIERVKLPFSGTEIERFNLMGAVGRISFTNDGKEVYYSRFKKGEGTILLELCRSKLNGGVWSAGEVLNINDDSSSSFHPFITADGKTLYFASDRTGGIGGFDLYKTTFGENGKWSAVENVKGVNTAADEIYPSFFDNQLYFASNGWSGLGGMDIFSSTIGSGILPENIGYPINSSSDDYSIVYVDSSNGYFATNRFGSDDIMRFNHTDKYVQIKSFVINKHTGLRQPNVSVVLEQLQENGTWKIVDKKQTDHTGVYSFNVRPNYTNYRVIIRAEGFDDMVMPVDTRGINSWKEISMAVIAPKVNQQPDVIEGVSIPEMPSTDNLFEGDIQLHHEFDRVDILPKERNSLTQVIEKLQSDPTLKLEIVSAADCLGDKEYNLKLSRKRAKYVYSLFPATLRKRITIKWVGNNDPKQPCADVEMNIQDQEVNRYTLLRVN